MAIVAYLRVSTDDQAENGFGMDAQLDSITKKIGVPERTYRDEGLSGKDATRPGLLEALESLRSGDLLAVAKRDRLARDTYLVLWIEKEAKRRGARIVSAAGEGGDGDDPAQVLLRRIVDSFAEYERLIIGQRTAAALKVKRERGEKTGGKYAPFGFRVSDDGVHLERDDREAATVDLIKGLRERGLSLREIAAEMEHRGILTKAGKTRWNPTTVSRILSRAA